MKNNLLCCAGGITGSGNDSYGVMIVGVAPTKDEIIRGEVFTSKSGKLLDAILEAAGWHRNKTYCTNLLCNSIREPSKQDIANCLPRLDREIKSVQPKLIVTIDELPCNVLTGYDLKSIRGFPIYSDKYKCRVLPTYNPRTIFSGNPYVVGTIFRDLRKIDLIINDPPFEDTVRFNVLDQSNIELLETLGNPVSLDIETSSLELDEYDSFKHRLLCMAFSDGNKTFVVPADVKFKIPQRDYIFHNGLFDVQGIYRYLGTQLQIAEDTMLQSYSLDERSGFHSLKNLAREYAGAGFYETDIIHKHKRGDIIDLDELYRYNAYDAHYTYKLHKILSKLQKEDGVTNIYKFMVEAANAYGQINRRGVYVSKKHISELALEWLPMWLEAEEYAKSFASWDINLNSPKQICQLLYDELHLPCNERTSREEVIKEINHPFIDALLKYREIDRMVSNWIIGIEKHIKDDGCVHPSVLLHGTVTGRPSYRNPALQTIPKEYKVGEFAAIRKIFRPRSDKYFIVEADYQRAEIWIAYSYSRDPQMYADLQGDFHTNTASSVYEKPPAQITPIERQNAKSITFSIMYGTTARRLSQTLGCSIKEATTYLNNWYKRYSRYYEWYQQTRQQAIDDGELVSLTGRKRRFYLIYGDKAHHALNQAVNFPVQSTSSDVCVSSLKKLHYLLQEYDSYVLFSVHDSLVFEVNKKYLSKVIPLIRNVMSGKHFEGVEPIPIDIKYGPSLWEIEPCTL